MERQKAVLFVCLGNICRSPACEGICRLLSKDRVTVASAGTSRWHRNECPDERSQEICMKHGIDISGCRARQIRADDWKLFDIIAALDDTVYENLINSRPPDAIAKVVLFNAPHGIQDPYYGGRTGFQKMFDQIYDAMMPFLTENGLIEAQN